MLSKQLTAAGTHASLSRCHRHSSQTLMLMLRLVWSVSRCTAARARPPALSSGSPVWRKRWRRSSSSPRRSTDCDATARRIRLHVVCSHGRISSTAAAAALMPLAQPVSRPGHAFQSNERSTSSKQRPAHPVSSGLSRRTIVIAALCASLLLGASAAGLFRVRRRLRGKPRRLIIRNSAGAQ